MTALVAPMAPDLAELLALGMARMEARNRPRSVAELVAYLDTAEAAAAQLWPLARSVLADLSAADVPVKLGRVMALARSITGPTDNDLLNLDVGIVALLVAIDNGRAIRSWEGAEAPPCPEECGNVVARGEAVCASCRREREGALSVSPCTGGAL